MKKSKLMATLTAAVMTAAMAIPAVSAAAKFNYAGDLNRDDKVTVEDAAMLRNYLSRKSMLSPKVRAYADVNNDGKVDVFDYMGVLRIALGKAEKKEVPSMTTKVTTQITTTATTVTTKATTAATTKATTATTKATTATTKATTATTKATTATTKETTATTKITTATTKATTATTKETTATTKITTATTEETTATTKATTTATEETTKATTTTVTEATTTTAEETTSATEETTTTAEVTTEAVSSETQSGNIIAPVSVDRAMLDLTTWSLGKAYQDHDQYYDSQSDFADNSIVMPEIKGSGTYTAKFTYKQEQQVGWLGIDLRGADKPYRESLTSYTEFRVTKLIVDGVEQSSDVLANINSQTSSAYRVLIGDKGLSNPMNLTSLEVEFVLGNGDPIVTTVTTEAETTATTTETTVSETEATEVSTEETTAETAATTAETAVSQTEATEVSQTEPTDNIKVVTVNKSFADTQTMKFKVADLISELDESDVVEGITLKFTAENSIVHFNFMFYTNSWIINESKNEAVEGSTYSYELSKDAVEKWSALSSSDEFCILKNYSPNSTLKLASIEFKLKS